MTYTKAQYNHLKVWVVNKQFAAMPEVVNMLVIELQFVVTVESGVEACGMRLALVTEKT